MGCDPSWKRQLKHLEKQMHRNKAIVAIARRMLVSIWHILTKRQPNLYFDEETISYKKLASVPLVGVWAWAMDEKSRSGMDPQQFAKYGLLQLGVGQDLERIVSCSFLIPNDSGQTG